MLINCENVLNVLYTIRQRHGKRCALHTTPMHTHSSLLNVIESLIYTSSICPTLRAGFKMLTSIDTFIHIYCSSFNAGYYSI